MASPMWRTRAEKEPAKKQQHQDKRAERGAAGERGVFVCERASVAHQGGEGAGKNSSNRARTEVGS